MSESQWLQRLGEIASQADALRTASPQERSAMLDKIREEAAALREEIQSDEQRHLSDGLRELVRGTGPWQLVLTFPGPHPPGSAAMTEVNKLKEPGELGPDVWATWFPDERRLRLVGDRPSLGPLAAVCATWPGEATMSLRPLPDDVFNHMWDGQVDIAAFAGGVSFQVLMDQSSVNSPRVRRAMGGEPEGLATAFGCEMPDYAG